MNDTISRQAAIDALEKWLHGLFGITEADGTATIFKTIRQLPPIQPKRGKWIGKYPVSSICSECGYLINDSKVKVFAFCPNCGAKMEVTT